MYFIIASYFVMIIGDGDENKTTPKATVVDNVLAAVEDLL